MSRVPCSSRSVASQNPQIALRRGAGVSNHDMALHYLPMTEVLKYFRSGSLKPSTYFSTVWKLFRKVNPLINASAFSFFEEAQNAARKADQKYKTGTARPLEGIPVAIKDETYVKGYLTTNGSLLLHDNVATTTDPVPQRLLDNGAYIHLRGATPEMSCGAVTWSHLWGVTRNPWNTDLTPGGSSGGCAAIVAAGLAPVANATDNGGSIRIPASQCGLVGVKASFGRIPESPPYNTDTYCHHGYLARTVADAAFLFEILAGPHPDDPSSQMTPTALGELNTFPANLKIAYSLDLGWYPIDQCVRKNTLNSLKILKKAGVVVDHVKINWDDRVISTARTHQLRNLGGIHIEKFYKSENKNKLTPYYKNFIDNIRKMTNEEIRLADSYAVFMSETMQRIFLDYDIFICPTTSTTDIDADFDSTSDKLFIDGKEIDPIKGWFLTYPFNTLSTHPVISIPTGLADTGVPTGIQIVGKPFDEKTMFQTAAMFERLTPHITGITHIPYIHNNINV